MSQAVKRTISRWIHIVFAIPIIGYCYSPFKELPNYAPVVRFVAVPVIVLTGLWMWKGHLFRKSGEIENRKLKMENVRG